MSNSFSWKERRAKISSIINLIFLLFLLYLFNIKLIIINYYNQKNLRVLHRCCCCCCVWLWSRKVKEKFNIFLLPPTKYVSLSFFIFQYIRRDLIAFIIYICSAFLLFIALIILSLYIYRDYHRLINFFYYW